MKKQLKKALAVVCAVAMVVAGITVVPNSVKADTTGVEAPAEQLKEIGGDAAATWFYDEAKTTGIEKVVNIQKNKLFSWGAWNHIGRRGPHSHGCKKYT